MFKKLVVGALATGIMLSGAGGAMAATPNTESPKQEKVIMAAQLVKVVEQGYISRYSIPNTKVEFGVTYYLKHAWQEADGTWTAYFEGWR
ncbi:LCI fold-containing protein [Bacillus albus]|uniref:LCI fold-containing protein n=1 Tax=Bacillus albus TaxID=2026189 RepID=UPI0018A189B4|nr:LCI fold-containing protein [Bacillus albus]MBF7156050.1 lysine 2,3-aminomutase [Bacillus albus]